MKAELKSLFNPSLQGSEWLFTEINPMIKFLGDVNIITKGEADMKFVLYLKILFILGNKLSRIKQIMKLSHFDIFVRGKNCDSSDLVILMRTLIPNKY